MKDSIFSVEHLQQSLNALVYHYNAGSSIPVLVFLGIALIFLCSRINSVTHPVDAPTVGKRSKWEPNFWVRTRFFQGARPIVKEGYHNVSFSLNSSHCHGTHPQTSSAIPGFGSYETMQI